MPIDKAGADLLLQIIGERYKRGSTIIATNRMCKKWPENFNSDSTLNPVMLDRLLRYAGFVTIEGKSYRMKGKTEP